MNAHKEQSSCAGQLRWTFQWTYSITLLSSFPYSQRRRFIYLLLVCDFYLNLNKLSFFFVCLYLLLSSLDFICMPFRNQIPSERQRLSLRRFLITSRRRTKPVLGHGQTANKQQQTMGTLRCFQAKIIRGRSHLRRHGT